jgi:hypothetical protein
MAQMRAFAETYRAWRFVVDSFPSFAGKQWPIDSGKNQAEGKKPVFSNCLI